MIDEKQVARRLGVADATVRKWRREGRIHADGTNPYRYHEATIAAFKHRQTRDHGPGCYRSHTIDNRNECDCVSCFCGPRHEPGGKLGVCKRCQRPRVEDLMAEHGWEQE